MSFTLALLRADGSRLVCLSHSIIQKGNDENISILIHSTFSMDILSP